MIPKHRAKRLWNVTAFVMTGLLLLLGLIQCTHKQSSTVTIQSTPLPPMHSMKLMKTAQQSEVSMETQQPEMITTSPRIEVDISKQQLNLYQGNHLLKTYPISTSKYGIGSQAGSNKTPLGQHIIAQKIGAGTPEGTIFKGRVNTGRIARIDQEGGDIVSSRIMWLEGLETGKNKGHGVDSYQRYIYIHGTAEEGKIGQPASHGCIRMYNRDVIHLFTQVDEGTPVNIICSQQDSNTQECLYANNIDGHS
ncbi:MAG: L,D-transpeptidase [Pseudomonadota bacterium]|nr:L,D-transpeptidase [Pseudomonadota bacterium]